MKRRRRLLSISHSYVVTMNRRLAHEMAKVGGDEWDVTAVAPRYFQGLRDLRPVRLDSMKDEPCPVVPVDAYLTGQVHFFTYGWRLKSLLFGPWDLVHCWEEPFLAAGGQVAPGGLRRVPLVSYSSQSLNKTYPLPPFHWIEDYAVARAARRHLLWSARSRDFEGQARLRPPLPWSPSRSVHRYGAISPRSPPGARRPARALGWSSDGPTLWGTSALGPREGADAHAARPSTSSARRGAPLLVGAGPMEGLAPKNGRSATWGSRPDL